VRRWIEGSDEFRTRQDLDGKGRYLAVFGLFSRKFLGGKSDSDECRSSVRRIAGGGVQSG
jgi:hypothetical protein